MYPTSIREKQIKAVKQTECCKVDECGQRRAFSAESGAGKWASSKRKETNLPSGDPCNNPHGVALHGDRHEVWTVENGNTRFYVIHSKTISLRSSDVPKIIDDTIDTHTKKDIMVIDHNDITSLVSLHRLKESCIMGLKLL